MVDFTHTFENGRTVKVSVYDRLQDGGAVHAIISVYNPDTGNEVDDLSMSDMEELNSVALAELDNYEMSCRVQMIEHSHNNYPA